LNQYGGLVTSDVVETSDLCCFRLWATLDKLS
jgi:hypothetical protein